MGAASKRARVIRRRDDFDVARLSRTLRAPAAPSGAYAWDLPSIVAARDAQLRGQFRLPARLAESSRTNAAIYPAQANRVAPQRCVRPVMVPAPGALGGSIARESEGLFGQHGIGVTIETLVDVNLTLANHGIAIGCNELRVRDDGSRTDLFMSHWPIEHVRWDPYARALKTAVEGGQEETIVHGDGRWVVFRAHETNPWTHGAILPASLVWASHAFAGRDWSKSSVAHGSAKVIGELPIGVALQIANVQTGAAELSPEAAAMIELLRAIATDDSPVGIRPAGSKTDFMVNTSTAWQVFAELVRNGDKYAARIYLGTDGILGAQGGAPGIDIGALFGVASTIVQGDFGVISRGLRSGVLEPWTAINWGDSRLAPTRSYLMPDPDADAARTSLATRTEAFYSEIDKAKSLGFSISQAFVDEIAAKHGITPPVLPEESKKAPAIALAPTDIARVVTVNEARASAGVGPLVLPDGARDPDGDLTVEAFSAKKAAASQAPTVPAQQSFDRQ